MFGYVFFSLHFFIFISLLFLKLFWYLSIFILFYMRLLLIQYFLYFPTERIKVYSILFDLFSCISHLNRTNKKTKGLLKASRPFFCVKMTTPAWFAAGAVQSTCVDMKWLISSAQCPLGGVQVSSSARNWLNAFPDSRRAGRRAAGPAREKELLPSLLLVALRWDLRVHGVFSRLDVVFSVAHPNILQVGKKCQIL